MQLLSCRCNKVDTEIPYKGLYNTARDNYREGDLLSTYIDCPRKFLLDLLRLDRPDY